MLLHNARALDVDRGEGSASDVTFQEASDDAVDVQLVGFGSHRAVVVRACRATLGAPLRSVLGALALFVVVARVGRRTLQVRAFRCTAPVRVQFTMADTHDRPDTNRASTFGLNRFTPIPYRGATVDSPPRSKRHAKTQRCHVSHSGDIFCVAKFNR